MNMGEVGWGLALQTLAFVSYNPREMRPGPSTNVGEVGWGLALQVRHTVPNQEC